MDATDRGKVHWNFKALDRLFRVCRDHYRNRLDPTGRGSMTLFRGPECSRWSCCNWGVASLWVEKTEDEVVGSAVWGFLRAAMLVFHSNLQGHLFEPSH